MKTLSLFLLHSNFLLFIVSAFWLFSRPQGGGKARRINSLYILGLMVGISHALISVDKVLLLNGILGLLFLLLSMGLFVATALVHSDKKLSPINSTDSPTHLVQRGPYKIIRHPFYTAYLLCFLGGAIAANSLWGMLGVLGLSYLYHLAADQEEKKFMGSVLRQQYDTYQQQTGKFIPILFRKPTNEIYKYPNSGIG